jgi:hypothetical protein
MSKKRKILFSILGILVLVFGYFLVSDQLRTKKKGEITVITDKTEYEKTESIIVKIKNSLSKDVCFSSCYPFFFERKNERWEVYPYEKCKEVDFVENCIFSGQEKIFQIDEIFATKGLHRLSIPVCYSCKVGDFFQQQGEIYSNEFLIK